MKHRVSANLLMGALLAGALCSGCSTHYRPHRSQRVAITIKGGQPTLYKNGSERDIGLFGGGLLDAVDGNPAAYEYAESHQSLRIGGFVVGLVGGATMGTGAAMAILGARDEGDQLLSFAGLGTMMAGTGMVLGALFMQMNAETKLHDAINVYNDGVREAPGARPTQRSDPEGRTPKRSTPKGTVDLSE